MTDRRRGHMAMMAPSPMIPPPIHNHATPGFTIARMVAWFSSVSKAISVRYRSFVSELATAGLAMGCGEFG